MNDLIKKLLYISYLYIFLFACSENPAQQDDKNDIEFPSKGSYEGSYWPTNEWRSCAPEEVNMDPDLLMKSYDYAGGSEFNTYSILIIRKGYIVGETYFNDASIHSLLQGYSFAKSFTNAIMGMAIDQQNINGIDDYAYNYISQWNKVTTDSVKKRVKIKHLLSMTAGLDWNYDSIRVDDYDMLDSGYYFEYVLTKSIIYEPGTHWNYSNGEAILISGILEAVLKMHVNLFASQALFHKIGINQINWSSSADVNGLTNTAYGIWATTRQYAKFGYLYLNKGEWDGEQVISRDWVNKSTKPVSQEFPHYGLYWWLLPGFENYTNYNIPDSTFFAVGARGQRICIVPEKDLLIVRMADDSPEQETTWDTLKFLSLIIESITE